MKLKRVFDVEVVSPGQRLSHAQLEQRKASVVRLVGAAFQRCGVDVARRSLAWSAGPAPGLRLHVACDADGQLLLELDPLASPDPSIAVDREMRRVSALLQSFSKRGVVYFSDVEELEAQVTGGIAYLREFAPRGPQDLSHVPIAHGDGELRAQLIHRLPTSFLADKKLVIQAKCKFVGTKTAKVLAEVGGEFRAKNEATLRWPRNAPWARQVADRLYGGMVAERLFQIRATASASRTGRVTRYDLHSADDLLTCDVLQ